MVSLKQLTNRFKRGRKMGTVTKIQDKWANLDKEIEMLNQKLDVDGIKLTELEIVGLVALFWLFCLMMFTTIK